MERWLLLSNCQTFGLANSFRLLNPDLSVEAADIWTYKNAHTRYNEEMASYDRVVSHPDIISMPEFDGSGARALNYLPSIDFMAYHPDFGYFWVDEEMISGPLGHYQSVIAVAAYNEGLDLQATRALFTGRNYERCGYYGDWMPQRDALISRFRDHGVNLADRFQRWGRESAFMYSVNHPRIAPLFDVAETFMKALGVPTISTDIVPSDNLLAGPCLPIYDEVAEVLGVRGSYLFKLNGEYRYISLENYLAESFKAYAALPPNTIRPHPHYEARYDRVTAVIRGEA